MRACGTIDVVLGLNSQMRGYSSFNCDLWFYQLHFILKGTRHYLLHLELLLAILGFQNK